ncbi:hypothetical protein FH593_20435 (plasmid) [Leptospira interrogans]|uniref:hypothetical protein n=1 Tax=Leptospira interrogans TaxID=173 RepID=UPI00046C8880|nr:hypothetical protein [Leptospira interrogans]ULG90669.1 hypothetical protein FH593_20730 [Leptospira interrogans]ULG90698.1 hypothetical protein FH593_20435 [Leptospira interrogans]UML78402.1 hypothetical protein FH583_21660 [Leptospira interrogans]UML78458.1 hypothetical protein FH583_21510 [Leptospira interrogans]
MPIKPENKKLYPSNWKEISLSIRNRAGNKCEWCGVRNKKWVQRTENAVWTKEKDPSNKEEEFELKLLGYSKIVLTVAHLNHDPSDCRDENLRALCQKCHLNYDKALHIKNSRITRDNKKSQKEPKLFICENNIRKTE